MEKQETHSSFNPNALPGGHYDTTTKTVVKQYPTLFAQYLLQRDDLEVTEVIDSEFPTVDARQMDVLMKIDIERRESRLRCGKKLNPGGSHARIFSVSVS